MKRLGLLKASAEPSPTHQRAAAGFSVDPTLLGSDASSVRYADLAHSCRFDNRRIGRMIESRRFHSSRTYLVSSSIPGAAKLLSRPRISSKSPPSNLESSTLKGPPRETVGAAGRRPGPVLTPWKRGDQEYRSLLVPTAPTAPRLKFSTPPRAPRSAACTASRGRPRRRGQLRRVALRRLSPPPREAARGPPSATAPMQRGSPSGLRP